MQTGIDLPLPVVYPEFARGCPKYYAHAHNVGGRGPAHVKLLYATSGRRVNSALCVRVASARAYPRVFLAFVGFCWPPIVAGSFE